MGSTMDPSVIEYMTQHINDTRAPELVGIAAMFLVLTLLTVTSRIVARYMTKVGLGADDYLLFIGEIFFIGMCVEYWIFPKYHLGWHVIALLPEDIVPLAKLTFALQTTYATGLTIVKLSILMLYKRIFSLRDARFRIAWWSAMTIVILYFIAIYAEIFLQCYPHPIQNFWDPNAECNPEYIRALLFGVVNACVDFLILILPIPMVWGLQMSLKRKFALSGVFWLGALVVVVSAVRVALLHPYNDPDESYTGVSALIWLLTELGTAIICANLPTMRPVFIGAYGVLSKLSSQFTSQGSSSPSKLNSGGKTGHWSGRRDRRWSTINGGETASQSSEHPIHLSDMKEYQVHADKQSRLSETRERDLESGTV